MQLFYTSDNDGRTFTLSGDDHRHCSKVLRKKVGDTIIATDGKGAEIHGVIQEISRNETKLSVEELIQHSPKGGKRIIAIAPTKNMSRTEWFLEKATEIGIDHVAPVLCGYSERKHMKSERAEKVLLSAMKQSQQFFIPQLDPLDSFENCLDKYADLPHKYIAYVPASEEHTLFNEKIEGSAIVIIGPEGGFKESEIALAENKGYKVVSLGKNRLRTETAGLVACHIINLKNV